MSIKQVIVMRKFFPDGKGGQMQLRRGKECAQASHASQAWLLKRINLSSGRNIVLSFSDDEQEWMSNLYTKICLQVNSEQELQDIFIAANLYKLEVHMITDLGK